MMKNLLNPQEVAKLLSVQTITVYKWVSRGLLTHHKLGKCIRFKLEDVERFVEDRRIDNG